MDSLEKGVEEVRACTLCHLAESRLNPVPGEGSPQTQLFFVGEGHGLRGRQAGTPFVGRAGELLNQALETVGLRRAEVFITNVVKCRPPRNRAPRTDEADACREYLERQLTLIQPKVICLLGNTTIERFLGEIKPGIRGKLRIENGRRLFPTIHPAAAIYNPRISKVREYISYGLNLS